MIQRSTTWLLPLCILLGAMLAVGASAQDPELDPPQECELIRDLADLIPATDEARIRKLCDELLTAQATPILVVTITSMAEHGGAGIRIETIRAIGERLSESLPAASGNVNELPNAMILLADGR